MPPALPDEPPQTPRKARKRAPLFSAPTERHDAAESGEVSGAGSVAGLAGTPPPFRGPMGIPRLEVYRSPRVTRETRVKIETLRAVIERVEGGAPPTPGAAAGGSGASRVPRGGYRIPYERALNPEQAAAVTAGGGPLLVIAGAGTGKTRTITYRVAYLVESGVDPRCILLLTFTRKAARQMLERADKLLERQVSAHIDGGTFHATANFLLRKYSALIGISPTFSILDTVDSEDVLDLIRREVRPELKDRAFPARGRIQEMISRARNTRQSLTDVVSHQYTGLRTYLGDLQEIADRYARYKVDNALLDFDDLVDLFLDRIRSVPVFAERLAARYRWILVDEYQDTNLPQKDMVDALAQSERNVMVVGDDSQSIYSFRGANYENILRFPQTYPDCAVVRLERNYRSRQDILAFTNDTVRCFTLGYPKRLYSRNDAPSPPVVGRFFSPEDEAKWIVDKVIGLHEKDIPYADMAVLYRMSFHSNYIQSELTLRKIPYVVYGGIKFTDRKHVKDVVAFLRVVLNPWDAVAWNRILKLVPGVGPVASGRIVAALRERDTLDLKGLGNKSSEVHLREIQIVLDEVSRRTDSPRDQLALVQEWYAEIMKRTWDDWDKRILDLEVLQTLASRYRSLERFLSDFALDPPSTRYQDQTAPRVDETEEPGLVLSTIHSAKGLEWKVVFVPHLLDGLFPSDRSVGSLEEVEEERRLFYVACTRAKDALYLTLPASFQSWGAWLTLPSRFLAEVNPALFRYVPDLLSVEEDEEDWV